MIRIDNKLFKLPTMGRKEWEEAKQSSVFRLDKMSTVWDFSMLYYDQKYIPMPLSQCLVLRSWLHYGGTCLMFLVRIQRFVRRVMRARSEEKLLAFAMAFHGRLGEAAVVSCVGTDLCEKIGKLVLK
jgi:hypothetical protein